jgi:predicted RNA-binding Zn ribbon-like protein
MMVMKEAPVEREKMREPYVFELTGGRLCLDFANTVSNHAGPHPTEHLHSYADLVSWGHQAGILSEEEAQLLFQEAARRPEEAQAVLARAIALREAIYRIFSSIAAGRPPQPDDVDLLNAALCEALSHLCCIDFADGRFTWGWRGPQNALERILWPVVRDAAELLTSGDLVRVRHCADDVCGWLFIDRSKNRSRRWCEMKTCGNKAKARRHYEKIRKQKHIRS